MRADFLGSPLLPGRPMPYAHPAADCATGRDPPPWPATENSSNFRGAFPGVFALLRAEGFDGLGEIGNRLVLLAEPCVCLAPQIPGSGGLASKLDGPRPSSFLR